jgi:hypothetical protein
MFKQLLANKNKIATVFNSDSGSPVRHLNTAKGFLRALLTSCPPLPCAHRNKNKINNREREEVATAVA